MGDEVAFGHLGQSTGRSARWAAGTRSSTGTSGIPVVRKVQARRPGWESSKRVGSAARPSSGADEALPPGASGPGHQATALASAAA